MLAGVKLVFAAERRCKLGPCADHSYVRYTFSSLFVALLLIGPTAARAEAKDPLATLKQGHPRLLWLDADVARVKTLTQTDPLAKEWFEKLRKGADDLIPQPVSERVLQGPRLLQVSRAVLNRVALLAGMYRLTGETKYADRARAEMLAAAKFEDWHPPHFLDTAEMTNAVSIGYDWLYDRLSPEDRALLKTAIVEKGLKPGVKYQTSNKGAHTTTNNWNQVCNGGLTVGALAIADEEPELARQIINNAIELIPAAMEHFAPDGGFEEGPGYWSYATQFNVYFISALQTALGTDFDFLKKPGFAETGMFRMQAAGPFNQTFNFADAGATVGGASQMFWMAKVFNKPVYAAHERAIGQNRGRIDAFHLFWFNDAGSQKDVDALPTAAMFKKVNVAFLRSAWMNEKAGFVGFKGGDNTASHGHADIGTFVYDADGIRWAMDLGPDDYNLPAYFGNKRWTYYRLRTEAHNTLTIGNENQNIQKSESPIVAFNDKPGEAFAVTDMTAAYAPSASRAQRGVQLLGRSLLVQDEVEGAEAQDWIWNFHTDATPKISGQTAVLSKSGKEMSVRILEPVDATFEIVSANPPPPQMQQPKVVNLTIKQPAKVKSLRLVVLLTPKGDKAPKVKPKPLAEWISVAPVTRP